MTPPIELDYIGLSPPPPPTAAATAAVEDDLSGTELRLGPPGSVSPCRVPAATLDLLPAAKAAGAKRGFADADAAKAPAVMSIKGKEEIVHEADKQAAPAPPQPAAKAQVVGWPPVRSYRKNTMATNQSKNKESAEVNQGQGFLYVKVSMDGAPYLRKVDLKMYRNYNDLSTALEKMFGGFTIGQLVSNVVLGKDNSSDSRNTNDISGTEYVLTYEDKDGDWMLVGDVPWDMFADSCRRLRIMKGSDAIGLAPRAAEKSKNRN